MQLRGLFSGAALAVLATAGAAETDLNTVTYTCERGVRVPVTFINQDEGLLRMQTHAKLPGPVLPETHVVEGFNEDRPPGCDFQAAG